MDNIIKKWNQVEDFLVGFLAMVSVLCVFYGMLGRYLFKSAPDWVEEVVVYMIIWSVFLVASTLVVEKGHVAATLLVEYFPIKVRRILEIFIAILALGFCVIVVWYGFQIVFQTYSVDQRSSTSLRFPLWIPYLAVPLGCMLVGMRYLIRIYRLLFKFQVSEIVGSHEMSREEVNL
jgi:C4-dicarboxylate transporter, DctQ subunit